MYSRPAGLGRRRRNRPRDGGVREPVKEKVFHKFSRCLLNMTIPSKISKYFLGKIFPPINFSALRADRPQNLFFRYISLSLAQLGSTNPCKFRGGGGPTRS